MPPKKNRKKKEAGIHHIDSLAHKYYQDSIKLRIRGLWRDAGDRLVKCAEIYVRSKLLLEAATIYTEAAESFIKVDKSEALNAYRLSIKLYCDVGRFDIGGKLERKVAYLHLYAKHYDDAAIHFRKAANFLAGDNLLDQSDFCLEKNAECLIELGQYEEASKLFEMVAKSCVNSNLRRFNTRDYLLKAVLCLFGVPEAKPYTIPSGPASSLAASYGSVISPNGDASHHASIDTSAGNSALSPMLSSSVNAGLGVGGGGAMMGTGGQLADDATVSSLGNQSAAAAGGSASAQAHATTNTTNTAAPARGSYKPPALYQTKYDKLFSLASSYDHIDFHWKLCNEKRFVQTILLARIESNKHDYVDHVYYWNDIHPLPRWCLMLVKIPLDEMQAELDRIARIKAEEEAAKKRAADRAKAIEEGRSVAETNTQKGEGSSHGAPTEVDGKTGGNNRVSMQSGGDTNNNNNNNNNQGRGSIRAASEKSAESGSVGRPSDARRSKQI